MDTVASAVTPVAGLGKLEHVEGPGFRVRWINVRDPLYIFRYGISSLM